MFLKYNCSKEYPPAFLQSRASGEVQEDNYISDISTNMGKK